MLIFGFFSCSNSEAPDREPYVEPLGPGPSSCARSPMGSTLPPEETSSIGVSGVDVVEGVSGQFEVQAADDLDESALVTVSFEPSVAGDTVVEERAATSPESAWRCHEGVGLAVPISLRIVADAFEGTGEGEVWARVPKGASEPDEYWVHASFLVGVSADLASFALDRFADRFGPCAGGARFTFGQSDRADRPWSAGPAGGLSVGCSYGDPAMDGELTVYSWGPED